MGIDVAALTTNADKLDKYIDKSEKREQERKEKDEQLYSVIERKVKKEKHKREQPKGRDGTIKKCTRLFKEGASPEVLTRLEESLREQEKYYRYYVQCFLPALDKKIKRSDGISNEIKGQVGQVISNIIGESSNQNLYSRRDSQDSGIESDNNNDHEHQISDSNLLLEAAKRGNKRKIKKLLQKGANISAKDGDDNNALHHIVSPKEKQIAPFEGKHKVTCLKLILKLSQDNELLKNQLREAINAKNKAEQTPIQKLLFSKITKEEHSSESVFGKIGKFLKRPFTEHDDNTIESAIQLFELGAKVDDLQLSKEELQNLEEYREYYLKFLEKLAESVRQSKLDQETKDSVIIKIAKITDGGYPLHKAVLDKNTNRFNDLLQRGYDITTEDAEQNTVLHCAVKLDGKAKYDFTKLILEKNKELINTSNGQQTPLYHLLQHIKEKSDDRSRTDRKFEKTNRYKALELFLQNDADITVQDKEGNNVLHYIALLKGGQKVTCLQLILDLVEKGKIPKSQLIDAVKALNGGRNTPLELALKKRAKKDIEYLSQGTTFDSAFKYNNTTKFCAKLLQNGANSSSLWLEDPEFHTKKYYFTLRDLKDYLETPHEIKEKIRELKEKLEEKYHCKTTSKKCKSVIKNTGSGIKKGAFATGKALSAFGKYISPANRTRELLAITITVTVIAMAAFAFFQGQVAIGAATSIIAVAGVICLTLTLGFSGIKKLFESSANKAEGLINNDQQNLGNEHKNSKEQKAQDQSEHAKSFPSSGIDDVSIFQFTKENNEQINKPSSLAL
ncbi:MAG: ankyrin repeat domain-containing protein [Wolbachia sp.]